MLRTPTQVAVARAFMGNPDARHWGYDLRKQSGVRSGVLYPMLTRWLDAGLLTDGWEDPATIQKKRPPRRYYRVTDRGREELGCLVVDPGRAKETKQ